MCLFPYICVKIQTCVEKHPGVNIPTSLGFLPNMLGINQTSAKMHMCGNFTHRFGCLQTYLQKAKHVRKKNYYASTEYSHIVFWWI